MNLTLRAAARVMLRVLAKSAAYFIVAFALLALFDAARGVFGSLNRALALLALAGWGSSALFVFRSKVREEAQRIGGRS